MNSISGFVKVKTHRMQYCIFLRINKLYTIVYCCRQCEYLYIVLELSGAECILSLAFILTFSFVLLWLQLSAFCLLVFEWIFLTFHPWCFIKQDYTFNLKTIIILEQHSLFCRSEPTITITTAFNTQKWKKFRKSYKQNQIASNRFKKVCEVYYIQSSLNQTCRRIENQAHQNSRP